MQTPSLPRGKRFAFTIIDDTDVATEANVRPIYGLLQDLGMLTTKTVWPVRCPEGSANYWESETLEDAHYREFVLELQACGFEIAFHGATMESSSRARTLRALERFREIFGHDPRVHANHAHNRENLYWGVDRLDDPILRRAYAAWLHQPADYYDGHVEGSDHWWGDLARERIQYVRNLTFRELNLSRINPTLPYRDPRRPLVRWWFSATDVENAAEFKQLFAPPAQDRLEREGGVCIVATHLGKGFVKAGEVDPVIRLQLERLAERDGWFVPVGELLDWLREHKAREELPPGEWRRMQWTWMRDLVARKVRWRAARAARRSQPR